MSQSDHALVIFIVVPFIVGAIVNFAPSWIWVPACIVFGVFWLGSIEVLRKS